MTDHVGVEGIGNVELSINESCVLILTKYQKRDPSEEGPFFQKKRNCTSILFSKPSFHGLPVIFSQTHGFFPGRVPTTAEEIENWRKSNTRTPPIRPPPLFWSNLCDRRRRRRRPCRQRGNVVVGGKRAIGRHSPPLLLLPPPHFPKISHHAMGGKGGGPSLGKTFDSLPRGTKSWLPSSETNKKRAGLVFF